MDGVIDVKCPKLLPIKGAAEATGLSPSFFRKGIKDGKIPYIKSGNKFYIHMPRLVAMLDDMTDESLVRL